MKCECWPWAHGAHEMPDSDAAATYSVELMRRHACAIVFGDIGLLKIAQEGAVASGVRRIEARIPAPVRFGAMWRSAMSMCCMTPPHDAESRPVEDLPSRVSANCLRNAKPLIVNCKRRQKANWPWLAAAARRLTRHDDSQSVRLQWHQPYLARCIDGLPAKAITQPRR